MKSHSERGMPGRRRTAGRMLRWVCMQGLQGLHGLGASHSWVCIPGIAQIDGRVCRASHSWVCIQKHSTAGQYHNQQGGGGGGCHKSSGFLQSLALLEQCGLMEQCSSLPAAQRWRGLEFDVSVQEVMLCQRDRDPRVWKRSQDAQQITRLVSMNLHSPPQRLSQNRALQAQPIPRPLDF